MGKFTKPEMQATGRPPRTHKPLLSGPHITEVPELRDPPINTEVEVSKSNNGLGGVAARKARRVLERIGKGEKISEAMDAEHVDKKELATEDHPFRRAVQQQILSYSLPPDARRLLQRALVNKTMAKGLNSEDPGEIKLGLDAAKIAAADPETGLGGGDQGGLTINLGELAGVFKRLAEYEPPEVLKEHDIRGQG